MEFVKMHGLGNDFVITHVASWQEAEVLQQYAVQLCDRYYGMELMVWSLLAAVKTLFYS
jgi:diaminopimelate epimerase